MTLSDMHETARILWRTGNKLFQFLMADKHKEYKYSDKFVQFSFESNAMQHLLHPMFLLAVAGELEYKTSTIPIQLETNMDIV